MEKARRLAQQGFKVLFTCYNHNLAENIKYTLKDIPGIEVSTFHDLCIRLARQARLLPDGPLGQKSNEFFDKTLPDLLSQAASKLKWQVDAVIVDEGQDFRDNWWEPLKLVLNDPEDGILYIFYDNNQRIYNSGQQYPVQNLDIPLNENCRNTQAIHRYVNQFYQSDIMPT